MSIDVKPSPREHYVERDGGEECYGQSGSDEICPDWKKKQVAGHTSETKKGPCRIQAQKTKRQRITPIPADIGFVCLRWSKISRSQLGFRGHVTYRTHRKCLGIEVKPILELVWYYIKYYHIHSSHMSRSRSLIFMSVPLTYVFISCSQLSVKIVSTAMNRKSSAKTCLALVILIAASSPQRSDGYTGCRRVSHGVKFTLKNQPYF